jgi:hypothetical protein
MSGDTPIDKAWLIQLFWDENAGSRRLMPWESAECAFIYDSPSGTVPIIVVKKFILRLGGSLCCAL